MRDSEAESCRWQPFINVELTGELSRIQRVPDFMVAMRTGEIRFVEAKLTHVPNRTALEPETFKAACRE